jgi:hypothetical protein
VDALYTRLGWESQLSEQIFAPSPYARADKIAYLRHAVGNGDYCVSAEQIAEKMTQEALVEMFTSHIDGRESGVWSS